MIKEIESIVCAEEKIKPEFLHIKTRKGNIKETRQKVMYLTKELTKMTFTAIGAYYELDHNTARHAHKTINDLMDSDKILRDNIQKHNRRITGALKLDKVVDENACKLQVLEIDYFILEQKMTELKNTINEIKRQYASLGFTVVNEISKA